MRLLAIGQLLLIALVIWRGRAPRPIRAATAMLLVGVCCYLTLATYLFRPVEGPLWALIQLAAQSVPLLLWIFAHLLFERAIDRRALIAGMVVTIGCWICFSSPAMRSWTCGLRSPWFNAARRSSLSAMRS